MFLFSGLMLILALLSVQNQTARAQTAVFINEIHYDNSGTDAGEAIEIAGPAGTDLSGWDLVLYNGSTGAPYTTTALSGVIPDQDNGFGTVVFSYPVNGIQNGSPDGMALVDPGDNVVQFLSYEGSVTATDGPAVGMTSTDIGVSEAGNEPVGLSLQLTGTGTEYEDFIWSGPSTHTFGAVNTGQSFGGVASAPVITTCGTTLTVAEGFGGSREVSASDADGRVVAMLINSITPIDPGTITLSGFVPAPEVGGIATASLEVGAATPAGSYTVEIVATNDDSPTPQTGTCSLSVNVQDVLTIGEVQGLVSDSDNGRTHVSPYVGQTVFVQGVIYQKTRNRTSSGLDNFGFFLQSAPGNTDGDPNSSDGIFVFMSRFQDLIGGYVPQVGDEVVLRARVAEFFNLTELTSASLVLLVRSGVDVEAEVPPNPVQPPDDFAEAGRYWERLEGMRAGVPAGSVVLAGRSVFASTADGEVWVAHPESSIAQRLEAYTNRSFRDPHPLDDIAAELFDNGNGYRIIMGSHGLKETEQDTSVLLAPARTFDTLLNAPAGGVYFSFSKYQIMVTEQLELENGLDPALNAPPDPANRELEYAVANFNVENLYDFRDDPFDGCDFSGNPGCPGVRPPFDYVPESDEAYFTRLNEIATQVLYDLHAPDIVMTQEVEDQDICTVAAFSLECGDTNNADGRPDALQDLALAIWGMGGPWYDSAFDRDGADDRGIINAYLFRSDRVELLPATSDHPVLGSDPQVVYRVPGLAYNADVQNPKVFNAPLPDDVDRSTGTDGDLVFTRPPQVGYFRIWRGGMGSSVWTDLYILDNHFSSTPNRRVGQRTEQALYNAAIVDALETAFGDPYVLVGGDLNVFPRPDDPFFPGDTLFPSDQLAPLYNQGLTNLIDMIMAEVPQAAYSYNFEGQAQTLDQIFSNAIALEELIAARYAHINADFPADYHGDGPRGTSDHDPLMARYFAGPTLERLEALLGYYLDSGAIDDKNGNISRILFHHLEQARVALENGDLQTYLDQLEAFANQVNGFSPRYITPEAAAALSGEARLLRSLSLP
jgi:predicted extracellular nuclease